MIFEQIEKINLDLDSSIEELKMHCILICEKSNFYLYKYVIKGIHHYSIEFDGKINGKPLNLTKIPHLKAVIKKEPNIIKCNVEIIHNYVDIVGVILLIITSLVLTVCYFSDNNSWLISIILGGPALIFFIYLRIQKLKSEKNELYQILKDLKECCEIGKENREAK